MIGMTNATSAFLLALIWIPLIALWGFTLFDMAFRDELEGWKIALWLLFIFLVPLLGSLVYWIMRPSRFSL